MPETLTKPANLYVVDNPEDGNPHTDHVYHFTSTDRVDPEHLILKPDPERGGLVSWRMLERFLDDHRPEHIKELGISRRGAVFANPAIAQINSDYSWGAWPKEQNRGTAHRVAVEIEVDPDKVLVCDARLLDAGMVKWTDISQSYADQAVRMADAYWQSAISLADFRRLYDPEVSGGQSAVQKALLKGEEPEPGYRGKYDQPEVLIPGPIPGDHLRIAAYGIHNQMLEYHLSAGQPTSLAA